MLGLASFFSFMTVAEGGGKRAVWSKFQEVYIPALKANYMVWPLVQVLNFRVMPIQFQIVGYTLLTRMRSLTNVMTALREHCGYRLDSIPLTHEFSGGAGDDASASLTLNDSCSLLPACLAYENSHRIGRSRGMAYVLAHRDWR
jgi:hypothetical protein